MLKRCFLQLDALLLLQEPAAQAPRSWQECGQSANGESFTATVWSESELLVVNDCSSHSTTCSACPGAVTIGLWVLMALSPACLANNVQSGHPGQELKACTPYTSGYKLGLQQDTERVKSCEVG
ncbi:hypothetical protein BTVI_129823 [Pitangus sulphuratus]|nr:hypothetical protein BTVI_129823 [Pitangus sulphuratus]